MMFSHVFPNNISLQSEVSLTAFLRFYLVHQALRVGDALWVPSGFATCPPPSKLLRVLSDEWLQYHLKLPPLSTAQLGLCSHTPWGQDLQSSEHGLLDLGNEEERCL